jgi:GxxExxY protein
MHELSKSRLKAEAEKEVVVIYDGIEVGKHRLDILVEEKLIVELKTVEALGRVHYAQVRSYLKATELHEAILVNMATPKADFRRITSNRTNHLRERGKS